MHKKEAYESYSKKHKIDMKFNMHVKNIKNCNPTIRLLKYVIMFFFFFFLVEVVIIGYI